MSKLGLIGPSSPPWLFGCGHGVWYEESCGSLVLESLAAGITLSKSPVTMP